MCRMNSTDEQNEITLTVNEITLTVNEISHCLQEFTHESESQSWNICRVPPKLRGLHEDGFNPTRVAIGPLHWYDSHLHLSSPMRAHKLRFLHRLLGKMTPPQPDVVEEMVISKQQLSDDHKNGAASCSTTTSSSSSSTNDNEKKIEHLVVTMKALEARTRACYSEKFNEIGSHEFVMMMIIDSCFVVELLRLYAKNLYAKKGSEYVKDPIFKTRWLVQSLKHDLIMLENQLPFPVLEKMFEMTTSYEDDQFGLTDLTLKFFNSLLPREKALSKGMCTVDTSRKPDHLLGLFWSSFQAPELPRVCSNNNIGSDHSSTFQLMHVIIDFPIKSIKTYLQTRQTDYSLRPWVHDRNLLIHCVTELREAGIFFKKRENHGLLDIDFKNGKLYIPPLLIDDYTGIMFLNFVAYEQCNPSTEPYFTTYLLFWDSLLNSAKDVEYLHSKGIIDHVLGSDEDVAQLFNKLCREVVHDHGDCYLSKVLEEVNQYFGVRSHRWGAKWRHDYWSSPWAFISLIAAVFLLILTFIQTFMALFSYIKPRS